MSLSYLINQSSKFIWYSAHYIISFKYATPIKIDKSNPPPFYGKMPNGRKLFLEMIHKQYQIELRRNGKILEGLKVINNNSKLKYDIQWIAGLLYWMTSVQPMKISRLKKE